MNIALITFDEEFIAKSALCDTTYTVAEASDINVGSRMLKRKSLDGQQSNSQAKNPKVNLLLNKDITSLF